MTVFDTNVVFWALIKEISHEQYCSCCDYLRRGGLVYRETTSELVYNFILRYRLDYAQECAKSCGELEVFKAGPKVYAAKCEMPPKWRTEAYRRFQQCLDRLMQTYSKVEFEDFQLVCQAIAFGIGLGKDWVDNITYAREYLNIGSVVSINNDIDVLRKEFPPEVAASRGKSVGPMNLV